MLILDWLEFGCVSTSGLHDFVVTRRQPDRAAGLRGSPVDSPARGARRIHLGSREWQTNDEAPSPETEKGESE